MQDYVTNYVVKMWKYVTLSIGYIRHVNSCLFIFAA